MDNEFEELKEMIKYQARTKMQLKKFKTEKDFAEEVRKELIENGLDIETLDGFLYNERDKAFELYNQFNGGELKHWSLKDLNDEFNNLVCDFEYVYEIDERYTDLTKEKNDFYNQYSRFMQNVFGKIKLEIAMRQKYGGERNMGDR